MQALVAERTMAKPKADRPGPKYENTKIESEVLRLARLVCASRNIGLAEFLTSMLAGPVAKEWDAELAREQAKKPRPK